MPGITANLEFLADLPLYKTEKPYGALLTNGAKHFAQGHRLDNIVFTHHSCNLIDVKNDESKTLSNNGFQIFRQHSDSMWNVNTLDGARRHREEIAAWLKNKLDAVFVHTYDLRTRLNDEADRDKVDVLDSLVVEPRARGAHNDVTLKSGPDIFFNHLIEGQMDFLKPGYRVRVIK
ncbi:hypothetical protein N0V93_004319 [Gnomoniopsis smithogilvyi]|uniref:Uncharacterized protein n=1 Tax=Gnomoniopsis smithogilvyi TaxID=1191159 RepID=A0A9W8YSD1_9PEZI|nr:hypothetical protein N0V93_004319 [Gnomoniopsis smithogilvyi]